MVKEVEIDPSLQMKISQILETLESGTDLEGCAVISSTGLRVACADSAETDADQFSVSPATLISLSSKIIEELKQGDLTEIVIAGEEGYSIVTVGSSKFILLSNCKKGYKLGYYFHRIRKTYKIIEKLLQDVELKPAAY
ncbi:MAG: hypothetical protein RBG13Loki_3466 [Promethearchaeota archaeon CR_4]|nr:MAG: hypothetical protein RBG13Loki_3466 [Candidatus Lokiarchaeota archaeon CR_4]